MAGRSLRRSRDENDAAIQSDLQGRNLLTKIGPAMSPARDAARYFTGFRSYAIVSSSARGFGIVNLVLLHRPGRADDDGRDHVVILHGQVHGLLQQVLALLLVELHPGLVEQLVHLRVRRAAPLKAPTFACAFCVCISDDSV
jgi:hypothetical protein